MILLKTEAGQLAFRDRTIRLTPRQRSAFFLCDGKRTVEEVKTAGMNIEWSDLEQMVELGMLVAANGALPEAAPASAQNGGSGSASPTIVPILNGHAQPAPSGSRSAQDRYKDAYPIATRLSGSLGLRGFRLNLAVEGTSSYEELLALAPKIRAAVGPEKAAELDRALNG